MRLFLNALGFQTAWWACVAGVGRGFEIHALVLGCVLMGLHLFFASQPRHEVQLAAVALIIGIVLDTGLQAAAVIRFYGWALGPLSPFWLWLLWVLFAMTLNTSLSFLQTRPLGWSALAGLVLGPLTYLAGAELGAAALVVTSAHVGILAVAWMVVLPFLVFVSKKFVVSTQGLT